MITDILLIVAGLAALFFGGDALLKAAVALSLRLRIPKIVIGMTVVSFATSAPELIVSINAALNGNPAIAFGNVMGSNIANLALVLAITVILSATEVRKSFYTTDWPVLMVSSGLLFLFIYNDGVLSRVEGIIFLVLLIAFLFYLLKVQKPAVVDELPEDDTPLSVGKTTLFIVLGGLGLWLGSNWLIDGSVGLATRFNVSERIIAVTIIAIGTSVPELAASIIAVLKKEKAISLGNLIGSNIFNILAVLGVTSVIQPIAGGEEFIYDLYWVLGVAFIILPLVFFPKGLRLGWRDGIILLMLYGIYLFSTLQ